VSRRLAAAWAGAALAALPWPGHAQSVVDHPGEPPVVQVVTITANKREDQLQAVPATATVVPARQLEQQQITTLEGLVQAVPSLGSTIRALSLRGVGGGSLSLAAEGSVGVLIDGVSLAGSAEFPPNLFDVERVEVIEGPQGTLFGRNASAGVIHVVTRAPSLLAATADLQQDLRSAGGRSTQAAVNLPVAGTMAFRVAGSVVDDPRIVHNLADDTWDAQHRENGRLRWLWQATPDLRLNLSADRSVNRQDGGAPWTIYRSTPGSLLSNTLAACGVQVGPTNTEACVDPSNRRRTEVGGGMLQLDWTLGANTLTGVAAWRRVHDQILAADLDSMPLAVPAYTQPQDKRHHQTSQELRLASPSSPRGHYVAGLYHFDGDVGQDLSTRLATPAQVLGQHSEVSAHTSSLAMFGDGTLRIADGWSVHGGLRVGRESVSARRRSALLADAVGPVGGPPALAPVDGSVSDRYLSWRAGGQVALSPRQRLYVGYTRGYKGPVVNDNATRPEVPLIVEPEIQRTLEAGLKSEFLDGRLAVNLSVYGSRTRDLQTLVWDGAAQTFVFDNAPSARSHGLSLNVYGRPLRGLSLSGGLAYVRSTFGDGFLVPCAQGSPPGCTRDAAGEQVGGTPRLRASLVAEQQFAWAGGQAALGLDLSARSRRVFNQSDPARDIGGQAIFGARLGWRSADGRWGVSVYGRNLFDRFQAAYRAGNLIGFVGGDTASYAQYVSAESGRLLGASLEARF